MPIRKLLTLVIFMLLPAAMVAAERTIQLDDGVAVRLFFFEPKVDSGPPPLAIFIAGGSNNEFMAKAQFWLGKEFVDRGWAIAVPLSPDGEAFSIGDSSILPQIIEQLYASQNLQDSKPILVGMSSGGSEAMALATDRPQLYRGVVATPGRIKSEVEFGALDGLALYIRVGEKDDFRWNRLLEPMTQRLRAAGAEVDSAIVPEARHVFQIDWTSLEAWLAKLR